ncbi:RNA polymerase sigma factor [Microbacterium sp. NPDC091382]|uniref:RNA polymerase sigma factor n=1 Tax=Microbacterium sp. NPDC091382 TaxID=3364210 RepID=UPI003809DB61
MVSVSDETDAALLFRLSRGDADAYRDLFRRHERATYRVALLLTHSAWDAEEVVASSFLELWRKRDKVRLVDNSVLPWLLTVVSFVAKNHLRGTRRYRRLLAKIPHEGIEPDHADEVARTVDALPVAAEVRVALGELNARDAAVLLLCVVQQFSARDASIALAVPEGTVKSRLSRVKARLRTRLSAYAPTAEEHYERLKSDAPRARSGESPRRPHAPRSHSAKVVEYAPWPPRNWRRWRTRCEHGHSVGRPARLATGERDVGCALLGHC